MNGLTEKIIGTAIEVHEVLGPGLGATLSIHANFTEEGRGASQGSGTKNFGARLWLHWDLLIGSGLIPERLRAWRRLQLEEPVEGQDLREPKITYYDPQFSPYDLLARRHQRPQCVFLGRGLRDN